MTKNQAIGIITKSAQIYETQFCDKNLLVIFGSPNCPRWISTKGEPKNFYHLTGVEINKQHILRDISDKSSNPIIVFYEKALHNMLSADDFSFKNKHTEQKLNVLAQTLHISSNAVMIGDYYNCRINLKTDKVTGGQSSFLGLVKDHDYYVPNTVISDDIRKNSNNIERVLAVLSKKINEKEYSKIEKIAKKIDINRLLQTIKQNVPIASELISLSSEKKDEITLQKETAVKKCDEILKANPELKAKLNAAAAEYLSKHNLPPLDSSSSADKRYEMRNKILKENPELMEEYINAKSEYEKKQLVPTAAKPTKSFAEGLEEFSKRRSENGYQKPPTHNEDLSSKRRK